jgi:uncharacterized membrane protein YsdA (DUF1294 family)
MEWIAIWILTVSLLAFFLFGMDKRFAKEKKQRIPEKILFLVSLLGGSVGSLLGMQIFRHKTKHLSFLLGIPACLIFNGAMVWLILFFLQ